MHFDLVDCVLERSADRIVTIKQVSAAEEYLQDHFPGFPVLPGVMMVESLVQAARRLLEGEPGSAMDRPRMVLCGVRALKYGSFVRPGETLRTDVSVTKRNDDGSVEFKAEGVVVGPDGVAGATAVSGRLTLRAVKAG